MPLCRRLSLARALCVMFVMMLIAALKVLEDCGAISVLIPFLANEGKQVLSPDVCLALYGPPNNPMKAARPLIQSSPANSALSRPGAHCGLVCLF